MPITPSHAVQGSKYLPVVNERYGVERVECNMKETLTHRSFGPSKASTNNASGILRNDAGQTPPRFARFRHAVRRAVLPRCRRDVWSRAARTVGALLRPARRPSPAVARPQLTAREVAGQDDPAGDRRR